MTCPTSFSLSMTEIRIQALVLRASKSTSLPMCCMVSPNLRTYTDFTPKVSETKLYQSMKSHIKYPQSLKLGPLNKILQMSWENLTVCHSPGGGLHQTGSSRCSGK